MNAVFRLYRDFMLFENFNTFNNFYPVFLIIIIRRFCNNCYIMVPENWRKN